MGSGCVCRQCYEEYGAPREIIAATDAAVSAVKALYEINGVGGAMHCVTDDWNLEDEFFVVADAHWSYDDDGAKDAAQAVCDLMKDMTIAQRATVLALVDGFITA